MITRITAVILSALSVLSAFKANSKKTSGAVWEYAEEQSNMTYLGEYYITGYDPYCSHCCGGKGITASGETAKMDYTAAMTGIPFGTKVYIEGLGTFEVQDRGVGDGVIDVACDGHDACYAVTGRYEVWQVG